MTLTERKTLTDLESVIERGLNTFVEVGQALAEISERRLYREQGYPTFEEYCQKRWGWSRQRGYQLIQAADVVANLSTQVDIPINERQARQLAPLPLSEQQEIAQAVDFSKVSTRELKAIIAQRTTHVAFNAGNNEWYTPPGYITAARNVRARRFGLQTLCRKR